LRLQKKKKREESEQRIKEYEKIVHDSKNEAKNYFNQAREKALKDINLKKDDLEKTLNEEDLNKINHLIISTVESKTDAKIRS